MYGRTIADADAPGKAAPSRVLTFLHEGTLFRHSFCMVDTATESIWVHTTGECLKGPLKGRTLEMIPSSLTSWGRWKARFPDTRVFLCEREPRRGVYLPDQEEESYGLGVVAPGAFGRGGAGGSARLFPYEALRPRQVLNTSFEGRPLLLVYHAASRIAAAWTAEVDGQATSFFAAQEEENQGSGTILVHDAETLSTWDGLDGLCIRGPRKGARLEPRVATTWSASRWKLFFPEAETWQPR